MIKAAENTSVAWQLRGKLTTLTHSDSLLLNFVWKAQSRQVITRAKIPNSFLTHYSHTHKTIFTSSLLSKDGFDVRSGRHIKMWINDMVKPSGGRFDFQHNVGEITPCWCLTVVMFYHFPFIILWKTGNLSAFFGCLLSFSLGSWISVLTTQAEYQQQDTQFD